jgi:hypothetical protein
MPSRFNRKAEIGTYHIGSDSNDMDNIFLTEQGWVYRHYKSEDFSRYWDEVLVPGDVPSAVVNGVSNAPLSDIMDDDNNIHFENLDGTGVLTTDGQPDITYSPDFAGSPKIATPLGTIGVTLTHNFPDEGNTIHDHEVGEFVAQLTFIPAEDHVGTTLNDVEDGLEFHWTHDGIHNDGDDIVGRDGEVVSYKFDSVGHHVVSVVVTSDNILNSGVAATDEFEVYGHIDDLSIDWPKDNLNNLPYFQGDKNKSYTVTVNYTGNIEGPVTVTEVKLIDDSGFIQNDWYKFGELEGNTFKFSPEFASDFEFQITVTHPDLSEPFTAKVPGRAHFQNNVLLDLDLPDLRPYGSTNFLNPSYMSDDWRLKDITNYGNNALSFVQGYGTDTDTITPNPTITAIGYNYLYSPDRLKHNGLTPHDYPNWEDGKIVGLKSSNMKGGRAIEIDYIINSDFVGSGDMQDSEYDTRSHVKTQVIVQGMTYIYSTNENLFLRTYGVDGTSAKDSDVLPSLQVNDKDYPSDKEWLSSINVDRYPEKGLNRVLYYPNKVKTLTVTLPANKVYDGMKDFRIWVHKNSDWSRANLHYAYFKTDEHFIHPSSGYYSFKLDLDHYRSQGERQIRISIADTDDINGLGVGKFQDASYKNLTSNQSVYIVLYDK